MFVVDVYSCAAQYIHYEVIHKATSMAFKVTVVYGANDVVVKEELWSDLEHISHRVKGLGLLLAILMIC